jgi:hypothetical protein
LGDADGEDDTSDGRENRHDEHDDVNEPPEQSPDASCEDCNRTRQQSLHLERHHLLPQLALPRGKARVVEGAV